MHNGVNLYNSAVNAVRELQSNGKNCFFIKRPTNKKVVEFLKKMKMEDSSLKRFTSGEAALNSLKKINLAKIFSPRPPKR